jgi:hypothetical protein
MLEAYLAAGSPCWRLFLSKVAENPEKWRGHPAKLSLEQWNLSLDKSDSH